MDSKNKKRYKKNLFTNRGRVMDENKLSSGYGGGINLETGIDIHPLIYQIDN